MGLNLCFDNDSVNSLGKDQCGEVPAQLHGFRVCIDKRYSFVGSDLIANAKRIRRSGKNVQ